ncbi:MAG: hypothetical protein H7329_20955, partial [Opitutaceae bacterium]|nr:hypothetical protein [Cytophagales bacterium]
PSNYVTSIVQDKYGMMWFGTFNGLVRFDGYNYKVFLHNEQDSFSLPDNLIRSLHLTADGNLLVANENHGFSIFDFESEHFTRYMHNEKDQNSLSNNNIIGLLVDSKGIVWIGTWKGLNRYDPKTKRFNFYHIKSNIMEDSNLEFISSIAEEPDGKLLLFCTGSRIIRFNPPTQTYDFINIPDLPKPKLRLNRGGILFIDKDRTVWIGSELNGITRLNSSNMSTKHYNVENGKLSSNIIMSIMQDNKGTLWVATDGGGLLKYDKNTDSFETFVNNPAEENSISGNAIYSIYQSKEGNIWAGAYASGLNVIKAHKRKFEFYGNKGSDGRKLSYKSVLSFAKADSGNIWIGTDGGGINFFNPKEKSFTYYNKSNSGICSDVIKSILKDSKGNIWMGTYGNGLCKANFQIKKFEHYSPFQDSAIKTIGHPNVWTIKEGKDSTVWIGFLDAGISRYNKISNRFEKFYYSNDKNALLKDASIMSMLVDTKNNLWVGSEAGGLSCIDPQRKNSSLFTKSNQLPTNNISALFEDSKNRIWIGTKGGGLSLLTDFKRKTFKSYTNENGLPGQAVNSIEEDLHGNLWLGTDNGLSRFDPEREKFLNFDLSDGLQSMEFAKSASLKDDNGFLYFGGTDGFNRFHPDSITFNKELPRVYISGFNLFNNRIEAGVHYNDKVYFNKPIHLLDTLILGHTDYVFSIEFACTEFTSPEKTQFAYMLDGFDKDWIYVDASKRSSTYTNLAPGNYTFKVKASNSDGIWNNKGKSLFIRVLPPWYNTWWFKSIVTLGVIIILLLLYYLRIRSIKKLNYQLTNLVSIKTAELQNVNLQLVLQNDMTTKSNRQLEAQQEEIISQRDELENINNRLNELNGTKDKLFSIIGHDLRNPVSALSSLTGMLQQNYSILSEKEKIQIVEHIQTSATSLKILVTNLLNWALVQGRNLHPQPETISVKDITNQCFNLLQLHAIGKNITFENNCSPVHLVYADSEMIQTVIRNLVSNSIKFTERDGTISISTFIGHDDDMVSIQVSDNGSGMDNEKVSSLLTKEKIISTKGTSQEKGTGIGLVIVREFIEANNGFLDIESLPGKGTTFTIRLPGDRILIA